MKNAKNYYHLVSGMEIDMNMKIWLKLSRRVQGRNGSIRASPARDVGGPVMELKVVPCVCRVCLWFTGTTAAVLSSLFQSTQNVVQFNLPSSFFFA